MGMTVEGVYGYQMGVSCLWLACWILYRFLRQPSFVQLGLLAGGNVDNAHLMVLAQFPVSSLGHAPSHPSVNYPLSDLNRHATSAPSFGRLSCASRTVISPGFWHGRISQRFFAREMNKVAVSFSLATRRPSGADMRIPDCHQLPRQ